MICAIYCRLSKEDEHHVQESESIQNQKNLLIRHAVQQGWDIYKLYCDDDCSGASRERPEWNEMLRDAELGRFQIVLCKTQSRFTRDLEMVERYIHGYFPLWGIRFVALLDHVDTDLAGNKKARQINGLINEWYLEDLSGNVRAVLDQKRRDGKHIGSFPAFGYRKDPHERGHLLVDWEAAEVVRRIFRLYLSGESAQSIARLLDGEGFPSPGQYRRVTEQGHPCSVTPAAQGHWSGTAVTRILKNELYIGNLVQGVRRKASYKSKQLLCVPKERWIRVEHTHEAIIDRETFDAAQERLRHRVRSDKTGIPHLLAGKVHCCDCGSTMRRLTNTYRGKTMSYLQCGRYAQNRKSPMCTGHTIRLDRLTAAVEERMRAMVAAYYGVPDAHRLQPETDLDRQIQRIKKEAGSLRAQEERLGEAIRLLYLDRVEGIVDREQFAEMNRALREDQLQKASRAEALERLLESRERQAAAPPEERIQELLALRTMDRELVGLLIERIEVGEKEGESAGQAVVIYWRV